MASYTVVRSKHATLTANVVDTVSFAQEIDINGLEIVNLGTTDIYVGLDGNTPTVAGDETLLVRAGESLYIDEGSAVKLISSGAAEYHVEGAR